MTFDDLRRQARDDFDVDLLPAVLGAVAGGFVLGLVFFLLDYVATEPYLRHPRYADVSRSMLGPFSTGAILAALGFVLFLYSKWQQYSATLRKIKAAEVAWHEKQAISQEAARQQQQQRQQRAAALAVERRAFFNEKLKPYFLACQAWQDAKGRYNTQVALYESNLNKYNQQKQALDAALKIQVPRFRAWLAEFRYAAALGPSELTPEEFTAALRREAMATPWLREPQAACLHTLGAEVAPIADVLPTPWLPLPPVPVAPVEPKEPPMPYDYPDNLIGARWKQVGNSWEPTEPYSLAFFKDWIAGRDFSL